MSACTRRNFDSNCTSVFIDTNSPPSSCTWGSGLSQYSPRPESVKCLASACSRRHLMFGNSRFFDSATSPAPCGSASWCYYLSTRVRYAANCSSARRSAWLEFSLHICALESLTHGHWEAMHFSSRTHHPFEEKSSKNHNNETKI